MNAGNFRSPYPHLNDRALGWLRFLHRKATTADDWTPDGEPHEWWDRTSTDPMCSFPRFDLQESTYAIGLMADQTPAWREVYATILEQLAERFLTYWAAVDWLSQFGADPRRKQYPPEWKGALIPEEFWGEYDAPGWVANGIEPWGLQPDPIGADGNLFFKGWLNLTQALHTYVTGEDKWGEPFAMAGVEGASFEWTQHRLVAHLQNQWLRTPMGPHCENTKAWPFCLSAAGLGLQMYQQLFGGGAHGVYQAWLDHTESDYYGFNKKTGALDWVAMYYDPLKEHIHRTAPALGLAIAFYALPQSPAFAEKLYRAAVAFMQWDNPASPIVPTGDDPRIMVLGLTMAKEVGDYATEARLRAYAESHFEPRDFDDGQFGYWFNLGENWPRGQLSALAMCAEVGEQGAWERLFRQPNLAKFEAPVLEGVSYPELNVVQAWNDPDAAALHVQIADAGSARSGQKTKLQVAQLPDADQVRVLCDGKLVDAWRKLEADRIEIDTTIAAHNFQIYTGYKFNQAKDDARIQAAGGIKKSPARAAAQAEQGTGAEANSNIEAATGAHRLILPPGAACACCAAAPQVATA